jgi:hypothetical protein
MHRGPDDPAGSSTVAQRHLLIRAEYSGSPVLPPGRDRWIAGLNAFPGSTSTKAATYLADSNRPCMRFPV